MDLFSFLEQLKGASIHFVLSSHRPGTVMVVAPVPGERWEIELLEGGEIEVEVFTSDREMGGGKRLAELLSRHSDCGKRTASSP